MPSTSEQTGIQVWDPLVRYGHWGLVGTRHARFSDFIYSPPTALRYLANMFSGRAQRYIGHSPAAAAYMIFALLACLAATVGTGLVAYGDSGKGPLASASGVVIVAAQAEDHEGHSEGGVIGDLHGALANITLGLVVLHLLGVGLASIVHSENLVGAMFTGRKRPEDEK